MDFHGMKRNALQALCKKHNLPANVTNLKMAEALASILNKAPEDIKPKHPSCLKGSSGEMAEKAVEVGVVDAKVKSRVSKKVTFILLEESPEGKSSPKRRKVARNASKRVETEETKMSCEMKEDDAIAEETQVNFVRTTRSRARQSLSGDAIQLLLLEKGKSRKGAKVASETNEVKSAPNGLNINCGNEDKMSLRSKKNGQTMGDEENSGKPCNEETETRAPEQAKATRRSMRNIPKIDVSILTNVEVQKDEIVVRDKPRKQSRKNGIGAQELSKEQRPLNGVADESSKKDNEIGGDGKNSMQPSKLNEGAEINAQQENVMTRRRSKRNVLKLGISDPAYVELQKDEVVVRDEPRKRSRKKSMGTELVSKKIEPQNKAAGKGSKKGGEIDEDWKNVEQPEKTNEEIEMHAQQEKVTRRSKRNVPKLGICVSSNIIMKEGEMVVQAEPQKRLRMNSKGKEESRKDLKSPDRELVIIASSEIDEPGDENVDDLVASSSENLSIDCTVCKMPISVDEVVLANDKLTAAEPELRSEITETLTEELHCGGTDIAVGKRSIEAVSACKDVDEISEVESDKIVHRVDSDELLETTWIQQADISIDASGTVSDADEADAKERTTEISLEHEGKTSTEGFTHVRDIETVPPLDCGETQANTQVIAETVAESIIPRSHDISLNHTTNDQGNAVPNFTCKECEKDEMHSLGQKADLEEDYLDFSLADQEALDHKDQKEFTKTDGGFAFTLEPVLGDCKVLFMEDEIAQGNSEEGVQEGAEDKINFSIGICRGVSEEPEETATHELDSTEYGNTQADDSEEIDHKGAEEEDISNKICTDAHGICEEAVMSALGSMENGNTPGNSEQSDHRDGEKGNGVWNETCTFVSEEPKEMPMPELSSKKLEVSPVEYGSGRTVSASDFEDSEENKEAADDIFGFMLVEFQGASETVTEVMCHNCQVGLELKENSDVEDKIRRSLEKNGEDVIVDEKENAKIALNKHDDSEWFENSIEVVLEKSEELCEFRGTNEMGPFATCALSPVGTTECIGVDPQEAHLTSSTEKSLDEETDFFCEHDVGQDPINSVDDVAMAAEQVEHESPVNCEQAEVRDKEKAEDNSWANEMKPSLLEDLTEASNEAGNIMTGSNELEHLEVVITPLAKHDCEAHDEFVEVKGSGEGLVNCKKVMALEDVQKENNFGWNYTAEVLEDKKECMDRIKSTLNNDILEEVWESVHAVDSELKYGNEAIENRENENTEIETLKHEEPLKMKEIEAMKADDTALGSSIIPSNTLEFQGVDQVHITLKDDIRCENGISLGPTDSICMSVVAEDLVESNSPVNGEAKLRLEDGQEVSEPQETSSSHPEDFGEISNIQAILQYLEHGIQVSPDVSLENLSCKNDFSIEVKGSGESVQLGFVISEKVLVDETIEKKDEFSSNHTEDMVEKESAEAGKKYLKCDHPEVNENVHGAGEENIDCKKSEEATNMKTLDLLGVQGSEKINADNSILGTVHQATNEDAEYQEKREIEVPMLSNERNSEQIDCMSEISQGVGREFLVHAVKAASVTMREDESIADNAGKEMSGHMETENVEGKENPKCIEHSDFASSEAVEEENASAVFDILELNAMAQIVEKGILKVMEENYNSDDTKDNTGENENLEFSLQNFDFDGSGISLPKAALELSLDNMFSDPKEFTKLNFFAETAPLNPELSADYCSSPFLALEHKASGLQNSEDSSHEQIDSSGQPKECELEREQLSSGLQDSEHSSHKQKNSSEQFEAAEPYLSSEPLLVTGMERQISGNRDGTSIVGMSSLKSYEENSSRRNIECSHDDKSQKQGGVEENGSISSRSIAVENVTHEAMSDLTGNGKLEAGMEEISSLNDVMWISTTQSQTSKLVENNRFWPLLADMKENTPVIKQEQLSTHKLGKSATSIRKRQALEDLRTLNW